MKLYFAYKDIFSKSARECISFFSILIYLLDDAKNNFFKKEVAMRYIFFDYVELCLKKISINMNYNYYNYYIKKMSDLRKFNLDEETFFIEFQDKILNG